MQYASYSHSKWMAALLLVLAGSSLLWIGCGRDDFAFDGATAMSETLHEAGIEHTFVESEGGHHWRVWRRYLRDVAPILFKSSAG